MDLLIEVGLPLLAGIIVAVSTIMVITYRTKLKQAELKRLHSENEVHIDSLKGLIAGFHGAPDMNESGFWKRAEKETHA
jgi:hypothetical protein